MTQFSRHACTLLKNVQTSENVKIKYPIIIKKKTE